MMGSRFVIWWHHATIRQYSWPSFTEGKSGLKCEARCVSHLCFGHPSLWLSQALVKALLSVWVWDSSYLGVCFTRAISVLPSYCYSLGLLRMAPVCPMCCWDPPLSLHNTDSRYQELIFLNFCNIYIAPQVWPHDSPCPITHTLAMTWL